MRLFPIKLFNNASEEFQENYINLDKLLWVTLEDSKEGKDFFDATFYMEGGSSIKIVIKRIGYDKFFKTLAKYNHPVTIKEKFLSLLFGK